MDTASEVDKLLVSIMKLECCILLSDFNRLCCVVVGVLSELDKSIHLKSNFYDYVVIQ